jgi:hypothetical protein
LKYIEAAGNVHLSKREKLSDILLDLILDSGNADKLTPELARPLIDTARGNKLSSESGLAMLLEAGVLLEPEKAPAALEAQGFPELATQLKKPIAK